ncbi:MAG: adenine deaminase [Haliscomenobacter sp.]|nr:adenine deaminase [Haliscomenobacter sp.]MBK9488025.1 adenine deaminase [Haliscomenobacter sp.]
MIIQGQIIDIHLRRIFPGEVQVSQGRIKGIRPLASAPQRYILPGLVDAHVHIESSMLVPSEFARLAVVHGTVATVSDPHEIANVLGIAGVEYMIQNGRLTPFKFYFGAPSCVPATGFESAGASIDASGVRTLLNMPEIKYLAEMMNYPGVLMADKEVMAKISIAQQLGKPIDGHAPGVIGVDAQRYFGAGISTDHECFTYEEALEKLKLGVKIIIREGSAAKNFNALIELLPQYPAQIMFCSDDKHPDDLINGHINQLIARALMNGCDLYDTIRAATLNPVQHYHLEVGLLREGDPADLIIVEDLSTFEVVETYINGQMVARRGQTLLDAVKAEVPNHFNTEIKTPADFVVKARTGAAVRVIEALNGEIVTRSTTVKLPISKGCVCSDPAQDVLKIAVVNRYKNAAPAIAFIKNFGLKEGAIASCVGHDSHNIIAVGVDDVSLCAAVNAIIRNRGGISAVNAEGEKVLPLPVAGIMTNADGYQTAKLYSEIDGFVKNTLGSTLSAPFMTLSFMALLVIPDLKISDLGLFSGKEFSFVELFI